MASSDHQPAQLANQQWCSRPKTSTCCVPPAPRQRLFSRISASSFFPFSFPCLLRNSIFDRDRRRKWDDKKRKEPTEGREEQAQGGDDALNFFSSVKRLAAPSSASSCVFLLLLCLLKSLQCYCFAIIILPLLHPLLARLIGCEEPPVRRGVEIYFRQAVWVQQKKRRKWTRRGR